MGVNETVFVQMEGAHLNTLTLHLEHENGIMVSEKKTVSGANEAGIATVELMVTCVMFQSKNSFRTLA